MGIEKLQITSVHDLFSGSRTSPTPEEMTIVDKTPNQHALACAVALSWARVSGSDPAAAIDMTMKLFSAMAINGHQADGPNYRNEQGAPDPHDGLWCGAMAGILREARLLGHEVLTNAAMGWFADHLNMLRPFQPTSSIRSALPCARAKAATGQALRPAWTTSDQVYAAITMRRGKLPPASPWPFVLDILNDSSALFAKIVQMSAQRPLRLALPIKRWDRVDGGYEAAFSRQTQLNDPCAWVEVDDAGNIVSAGRLLSEHDEPEETAMIVGGAAAGVAPGVTTPPVVTKTPASSSAELDSILTSIAELLERIRSVT